MNFLRGAGQLAFSARRRRHHHVFWFSLQESPQICPRTSLAREWRATNRDLLAGVFGCEIYSEMEAMEVLLAFNIGKIGNPQNAESEHRFKLVVHWEPTNIHSEILRIHLLTFLSITSPMKTSFLFPSYDVNPLLFCPITDSLVFFYFNAGWNTSTLEVDWFTDKSFSFWFLVRIREMWEREASSYNLDVSVQMKRML